MKYYDRFINWIENGDILLPVILVAVVHYAAGLAQYDFWLVAAAIGILVDISHYRAVKLYYAGKSGWWATILTVWSFFMHVFYYYNEGAEWWAIPFGATIPLIIFCLGWITKTQKLDEKIARTVSKDQSKENNSLRRNEIPMGIPSDVSGIPIVSDIPRILPSETDNKIKRDPKILKTIMDRFSVSRSTAYRKWDYYLNQLGDN